MNIFFLVFFLICKFDLREVDFACLLDICVNQNHDCYQKAWIEFERRYRPLIFGQTHRQLNRWNKAGDVDIMADISNKITERLIVNNFKTLRMFRERQHEGKFIKFLSVISRNTANAELAKLFSKKIVSIEEEEIHGTLQAFEVSENMEDIHDLVVRRLRRKSANTQKSAFHKERDILTYTLRKIAGFRSKEVAKIPVLNITPHNVDIVMDRISDLIK